MRHNMQREKLYNFQRTVYIICAACVFKSSKILSTRFSTVTKFCTNEDFLFSYFIFLSINMLSQKKTEYVERCSVKSSTIQKEQVILIMYFLFSKRSKILEYFSQQHRELVAQNIAYFETKSTRLKYALYCRLQGFSRCIFWYVFVFLNKMFSWIKM